MQTVPGTLAAIAFDADDTLWQNERFFRATEDRFAELLAAWGEPAAISAHLLSVEKRNVGLYGFGTKGFML